MMLTQTLAAESLGELVDDLHRTAHKLRDGLADLNRRLSEVALERDELRSELAALIAKYERGGR